MIRPSCSRDKPIWKTSSFLVYAGGLTVLVAAIGGAGISLHQLRQGRAHRLGAARPRHPAVHRGGAASAGALGRGRDLRVRLGDRLGGLRRARVELVRLARQLELGLRRLVARPPFARVPHPRRGARRPVPLAFPVHRAHLDRRRLVLRHRLHLERRHLDVRRDAGRSGSSICSRASPAARRRRSGCTSSVAC